MDLEQARIEKEKLESLIKEAFRDFTRKTGLWVTDCKAGISRGTDEFGCPDKNRRYHPSVTVEL